MTFKLAADAVPQDKVPQIKLNDGTTMPGIGMGTFGSDRFTHEEVAEGVKMAIQYGFRFLDCASIYGNEDQIGNIVKEVIDSGELKREDLYIDSKVWNDQHAYDDVIAACKKTIADLQCDYLDLYLVHWPFRNFHPIGCTVDSRSPDSHPFCKEEFAETWRAMEDLVKMGLVKSIGTSNMTIPKYEYLLEICTIKPVVNEMELHPHMQQPELWNYLVENQVQPIGFCPIGSPTRPDRDKTEDDTCDIEDPVVLKIAKRLGVHPAVVCIKWAVQRGHIPIPFSVRDFEIKSNIECVSITEKITDEEMAELATINKDCRLIKAPVFLWEGAESWEDLWDIDGKIVTHPDYKS